MGLCTAQSMTGIYDGDVLNFKVHSLAFVCS